VEQRLSDIRQLFLTPRSSGRNSLLFLFLQIQVFPHRTFFLGGKMDSKEDVALQTAREITAAQLKSLNSKNSKLTGSYLNPGAATTPRYFLWPLQQEKSAQDNHKPDPNAYPPTEYREKFMKFDSPSIAPETVSSASKLAGGQSRNPIPEYEEFATTKTWGSVYDKEFDSKNANTDDMAGLPVDELGRKPKPTFFAWAVSKEPEVEPKASRSPQTESAENPLNCLPETEFKPSEYDSEYHWFQKQEVENSRGTAMRVVNAGGPPMGLYEEAKDASKWASESTRGFPVPSAEPEETSVAETPLFEEPEEPCAGIASDMPQQAYPKNFAWEGLAAENPSSSVNTTSFQWKASEPPQKVMPSDEGLGFANVNLSSTWTSEYDDEYISARKRSVMKKQNPNTEGKTVQSEGPIPADSLSDSVGKLTFENDSLEGSAGFPEAHESLSAVDPSAASSAESIPVVPTFKHTIIVPEDEQQPIPPPLPPNHVIVPDWDPLANPVKIRQSEAPAPPMPAPKHTATSLSRVMNGFDGCASGGEFATEYDAKFIWSGPPRKAPSEPEPAPVVFVRPEKENIIVPQIIAPLPTAKVIDAKDDNRFFSKRFGTYKNCSSEYDSKFAWPKPSSTPAPGAGMHTKSSAKMAAITGGSATGEMSTDSLQPRSSGGAPVHAKPVTRVPTFNPYKSSKVVGKASSAYPAGAGDAYIGNKLFSDYTQQRASASELCAESQARSVAAARMSAAKAKSIARGYGPIRTIQRGRRACAEKATSTSSAKLFLKAAARYPPKSDRQLGRWVSESKRAYKLPS
jgi:hypothetical protein